MGDLGAKMNTANTATFSCNVNRIPPSHTVPAFIRASKDLSLRLPMFLLDGAYLMGKLSCQIGGKNTELKNVIASRSI